MNPQKLQEHTLELAQILQRLRSPQGCAWNRAQTFESLKTFLLEEAYETLSAVHDASENRPEAAMRLKEELGDLLLQIVFLGTVAEEKNMFTLEEIPQGIADKLKRRHPHVFADAKADSPEEVARLWEQVKQEEKRRKPKLEGALSGVPAVMPALQRGQAVSGKAAALGFDWPNLRGVVDKLDEEIGELKQALRSTPQDNAAITHELGDVLFTLCNVARFLKISAEQTLLEGVSRFEKRFAFMEKTLAARQSSVERESIELLEQLWQAAKTDEQKPRS